LKSTHFEHFLEKKMCSVHGRRLGVLVEGELGGVAIAV
jgi:hypothetical protein